MAQNIIHSPWGKTKGPWLCLMTTLLLFSLLRLFSIISVFLVSPIKLILWLLKFPTSKRQAEDMVGGEDYRVLLCFYPPFAVIFLSLEEGQVQNKKANNLAQQPDKHLKTTRHMTMGTIIKTYFVVFFVLMIKADVQCTFNTLFKRPQTGCLG